MSKQLLKATKQILTMSYYKNDQARSGQVVHGHENAVATKLLEAGFSETNKKDYPKLGKAVLKEWARNSVDTNLRIALADMPLGSIIVQPAGSQGFPDILVRDFDDRFIGFECKSTKNGTCPMWNDSLPRPNAVYIFNSGKYNTTTVFLGHDVITDALQSLLDKKEQEYKKIDNKYKKLVDELDIHNRGWQQKARKQHFQYGGKDKTDYFSHTKRTICEQNVLNFVK